MVRIYFDEPATLDTEMSVPLEFAKGCMKRESGVEELADAAIEDCRRLRETRAGDPFVLHLSGIVSFIMSNAEAAKWFWAEACNASPGYEHAWTALSDVLVDDPDWADPEAYAAAVAEGKPSMISAYAARAGAAFEAGHYAVADLWVQRISALNNPGIAQLHGLAECRARSAELLASDRMGASCRGVAAKYQRYWGGISETEIRASSADYETMPDRHQLANIATRIVDAAGGSAPTVMELGCFAGFNLQNIPNGLS